MQISGTTDLGKRALRGTLLFVVVLWLMIFLPAGSLSYWQGWLFWTHFAIWTVAGTLYFLKRDPALVERRLRAGPMAEREPSQKLIQLATSITVCGTFVASALDYRFSWSKVPVAGVLLGNALVAVGYLAIFVVLRENSYASAIVQVDPDQKVISTGPYSLVRHPMYTGAIAMFAGTPMALASWWGLVPVALLAMALVARLLDEEEYLIGHLQGYADYRRKVHYRLVPRVW